jgi:hypothetical protein
MFEYSKAGTVVLSCKGKWRPLLFNALLFGHNSLGYISLATVAAWGLVMPSAYFNIAGATPST